MEKKKETSKNTKKTVTKKTSSTTKKSPAKKEVNNKTTKETKTVETEVKKEPVKEVKSVPEVQKNVKIKKDDDFGGDEIRKLLIIIGIVCTIMLIFYFITEGVVKKKNSEKQTEEPEVVIEPDIDYDTILMGSMFEQPESSYYVFAYDPDDYYNTVYSAYLDTYSQMEDSLRVYMADLSSGFNKTYIAEESYLEGYDASQIKVTGPTLIRIEEGEIYLVFEGHDEILDRLKYITEE